MNDMYRHIGKSKCNTCMGTIDHERKKINQNHEESERKKVREKGDCVIIMTSERYDR
jgi:hypothetical protein